MKNSEENKLDPETEEFLSGLIELGKESGIKSCEWWKEDKMETKNEKIGVACALIAMHGNKRKIWLSQRLGSYENGKYACPGGMVDATDSSDVHAIQRELVEETHINIADLTRFKRSIVSHHPGGKSDITQWFVLELTNWWNEVPYHAEPQKHGEWKMYSIEEAKSLPLMVGTNEVLNTL